MSLGVFIAGAYTGQYNSVAIGITDNGYELQWETKVDAIEKSDVYGDMMIDGVYRGVNYFMQAEFLEGTTAAGQAAFPWAAFGTPGIIGRLMSNVAAALLLTATTGTPAVATPATLTAPGAILAPGSNPAVQYNSRLRTVPVRFVLLPYNSAGTIKSFTLT